MRIPVVVILKRLSPTTPPFSTLLKDTHGLDKPQTEFEQWINVMWWLKQHSGPVMASDGENDGDTESSKEAAVVADASMVQGADDLA